MAEQEPSSVREQLEAAKEAEQAAESRLTHLAEQKASTGMLSELEELEEIRLERRVGTLAALITRLEHELRAFPVKTRNFGR